MINLIGCLIVSIVGLLIGNVESISIKETKILTILGWLIVLLFAKGSIE